MNRGEAIGELIKLAIKAALVFGGIVFLAIRFG